MAARPSISRNALASGFCSPGEEPDASAFRLRGEVDSEFVDEIRGVNRYQYL
jgi:hypothetical protein